MRILPLLSLGFAFHAGIAFSPAATTARPFQKLHIPELVVGHDFTLKLHKSSQSFWQGATTQTLAYNQEHFWGPTLVIQQGDTVSFHVQNELVDATTTHWHGLHLPAAMDGGPLQVIPAGKTWTATFKAMNQAGTYWYHPHAHETTQQQQTLGAGGLIIIRDPAEAALALPREYGVDDLPLVLTSRRFLLNAQFSFDGDNDKYGDYPFANGTLDAEVCLPAQLVRLRILNAEVERGYDFGFSDGRTFHVMATDGGLVAKPIPVQRMKLMVGERVEVLLNLSNDKVGSTLDLMTFNSRQPFGFPGGEPGSTPPNGGYLNNIDFRLLHINVGQRTGNALLKIPETLIKQTLWTAADATEKRLLRITGGRPTFDFDDQPFSRNVINQRVKLGSTEEWTIQNNNIFGHSFHLHDVQFSIVARTSGVADYERGWKDTLYIPRGESVSFVARFEHYASPTDAFMYHCHMSNHEDGGLMGQFLVVEH